ncbi:MAG: hypothetical protein JST09_09260, partial [Bacteroidetes bacterium]|nr:hypothetical protein [Bacteroidota bacterium]
MKMLFSYLLQLITISGIFNSYYHFFLRNKKFHGYNRFYLLSSLVISILIPFFNIPVYFESREVISSPLFQALTTIKPGGFEDNIPVIKSPASVNTTINWSAIILLVYSLALLILFIRLIISITKIFRLKNKFPTEKIEKINFITTDDPSTPFSFFRNLFWNKKIPLDSEEGKQILKHECYHIERNHSHDILLLEIAT